MGILKASTAPAANSDNYLHVIKGRPSIRTCKAGKSHSHTVRHALEACGLVKKAKYSVEHRNKPPLLKRLVNKALDKVNFVTPVNKLSNFRLPAPVLGSLTFMTSFKGASSVCRSLMAGVCKTTTAVHDRFVEITGNNPFLNLFGGGVLSLTD